MAFFASDAGWHLGTAGASVAAVAALVFAGAFFAVTFNDMARLRRRAWYRREEEPPLNRSGIRTVELGGYSPGRLPTVVPTVPVFLIVLVPYFLAYDIWQTSSSSWTDRFEAAGAVLTVLLAAWTGRGGADGLVMRGLERATAPLSELIGRAVLRAWGACRLAMVFLITVGLLTFAIYIKVPVREQASLEPWAEYGVMLIGLGLMFGVVLKDWRRPTDVKVVPASELVGVYVGDALSARITTLLSTGVCLAALGWLVVAAAR